MGDKKTRLENQDLILEVAAYGGELSRIYDKVHQREVLWEGTPAIWGRHAPVLFPFVGKLWEGRYHFQGKTYGMTAHGFARDMEHRLLSQTEDEVWYVLEDTEETFQKYPFHFRLETGHRLEENRIRVMWKVVDTGEEPLYFMLGGHPAFKTPEGATVHDFTLQFEQEGEGPLHYQAPDADGYKVEALSGDLALEDGKARIVPGFFDRALTYIFDRGQVKAVSLLLADGRPYVTVRCPHTPFLGVWTIEKTHPFVCLEPWFGRCDERGYQGELADREGEMCLAPGQTFTADYVIEIHR